MNPTPLRKSNSICQCYSFTNLEYTLSKFIIALLYYISKSIGFNILYMQCFMLLSFLIIWNNLNNEHPYYFETLNIIRSGTLVMVIFPSIVSLIANLFNFTSIVIPILNMVVVVVGGIFGVYLYKRSYKRKIANILSKLKEKNILYINLENEYARAASESSKSSDDEEKSASSSSNSENEEIEMNNNSGDGSSSESDESLSSETMLTKKKVNYSQETLGKINLKKDIFDSIEDIVNKHVIKEPILVFKSPRQIELACRFLRYYQDENNYHENCKIDVDLLLKSEVSSNSMSFTEKADGIKRNYLLKYFVNYLVKLMVEKQRDTSEHDNKEVLNKYIKYQNKAVRNHISSLYTLKSFFKKIKQNLDNNVASILKEVDIDSYLELILSSKSHTEKNYKFLISNFPNEK
ncbi:hypothetical protein PIROE2DRAFT_16388, partial [Piromyces sp. E2]